MNGLNGTIFLCDLQYNRHCQFFLICQRDDSAFCRVAVYIIHRLYGLVEFPGGEKPRLEEPVQILAGSIIHHPEKVVRQWVFECPVLDVFVKSIVKTLWAKHIVTQNGKT